MKKEAPKEITLTKAEFLALSMYTSMFVVLIPTLERNGLLTAGILQQLAKDIPLLKSLMAKAQELQDQISPVSESN